MTLPPTSPLLRLKPIPTRHRGVLMRSKLEAKVAAAMDRVGIDWEYEAQGYDLDGVWYLPDFWCPKIRTFVEVKGVMDADSIRKIDLLAQKANGLRGNSISGMSERLWSDPAQHDQPCDAPTFDERTGVHVVVLPRADITTGHYAPSLCGFWGFEFDCAGARRIRGTVISEASDGIDWDTDDFAILTRCQLCSATFWRANAGWHGCYVCGAGRYPYGKYSPIRSVTRAS